MKNLRFLFVFSIVMTITLFSCEKETIDYGDAPENVSFSADIQPIFSNQCIQCHNTGSERVDFTEGNSYQAITTNNLINNNEPESSYLYSILLSGGHEPRATQLEKKYILAWIEQGAKNN